MARPRIFVSSTYYDLRHVRTSLESFISSLGYESILFESGDIPFHYDQPLDQSCYEAVETADVFVLIIGGRFGSSASGQEVQPHVERSSAEGVSQMYAFYNSITMEEYTTARKCDVPIYIFVDKGVSAEFQTFKKNRASADIRYAHVDNVGVFRLLEDIFRQSRNNLVRDFERISDITNWLRDQWAGLFADLLKRRKAGPSIVTLSAQLDSLAQVAEALKSYSEEIVSRVEPDKRRSSQVINDVNRRLTENTLATNNLIKFVLGKRANPDSPVDYSGLQRAVLKSNDVEEFIAELDISDDGAKELRGRFQHTAEADLRRIKDALTSSDANDEDQDAAGQSLASHARAKPLNGIRKIRQQ